MMKVCRLVRSTHLQGTSLRPLVPPFDRSSKHFASPSWMFFVIHATNHTENPLRQHFSPLPAKMVAQAVFMDDRSIPSSCSLFQGFSPVKKGPFLKAEHVRLTGVITNPIGVMTHPMKISGSGPPCHRYSKKKTPRYMREIRFATTRKQLWLNLASPAKKIGEHWREFLGSNTWEAKQWHAPVVCLMVYTPIFSMGLQN